MRGKVPKSGGVMAGNRITPAYAGKSSVVLRWIRAVEDHPRLCGEKRYVKSTRYVVPGSPPPMRGKAIRHRQQQHQSRITPAYAGKRLVEYTYFHYY